MIAKKPVKVYWFPAEEHGRRYPPPGPKYFGVFKSKSPKINDESWSVLLEINSQAGHKYWQNADLSFVSDDAPASSLNPGSTFYLFEGRWPVAEGVVLQEPDADA